MSYSEKCLQERCLLGRNVLLGEMSQGEMSQGELSQGEMAFGEKCLTFKKNPLQKCAYFEVGSNILPKKVSSFDGCGLEMYDRVLTSHLFDGMALYFC